MVAGSSKWSRKIFGCLHSNALLILTILGVGVGACFGLALWEERLDDKWKTVIGFPGEILMNLFKMIILPLITVTLMCGVGKMDRKQLGFIGGFALLFFVITTLISVVIGIVAVWLVHPGKVGSLGLAASEVNKSILDRETQPEAIDTFLDILRNAFPDNLFDSTLRFARTKIVLIEKTDSLTNRTTINEKRVLKKEFGSNILGLVVFSMIFGGVLSFMGNESKPLIDALNVADKAICKMVMMVVWYSPFAIVSLVAGKILDIDEPGDVLGSFGSYLALSMGSQFVVFILQNLVYTVFACANPFRLIYSQLKAIAMAFGTSSSIATLPVNMECIENNMGVRREISQVVLPIAATINMNGTGIHIAVSAIFIAQLNGAVLTFSDYAVVWITSTLAAIGTAAVPSGSVFTMAVVLAAIRQPIADVAIIFPVDWIINRFRVVTNTYGDAVIACILNRHFKEKQQEETKKSSLTSTETEETMV